MFGSNVVLFACGAALIVGCSGAGTTSTGGTGDGGTGSSGSSGGAAGSSGSSGGAAAGAPTAKCQSGQTNVAAEWYAVSACKTYFDTVERCTCASQPDVASCQANFSTSLASSLCYPQGVTFSAAAATMACDQALQTYKQASPKCS